MPQNYLNENKAFMKKENEVEKKDLPLEFFMNRFRLSEPCPKVEFTRKTGLGVDCI